MARRKRPRFERPPASAPAPEGAGDERVAAAVSDLRARMRQAAKPAVADAHARSYGPDAPVYGLTVADANRLGQDAMRRVRGAGLPLALAIAEPLFASGNLEEGVAAAVIVGAQARNLGAEHFERFDAWASALTNEVNADGLSALASRCLSGRPSLVNTLKEWAASDNRFRRRAALTAFIPLVREGRFLSDALGVADLLLADEDEAVQSGLGTLLMEAGRLQRERVGAYLNERGDAVSQTARAIALSRVRPERRSQADAG